jgi:crossover junction endodeoxyribonuclease RuvC
MPRILGIDPGLQITGYGIVDLRAGALDPALVEAGVFRFKVSESLERRLLQLYEDLTALLDEFKPDRIAVEKLYAHYAHPNTAILMGHARGVILLTAQQRDLPVEHLPSTEVKKAITGHGHASKEQMQRAIQAQCQLSELPNPPDVADAIAIALTHARRLAIDRM